MNYPFLRQKIFLWVNKLIIPSPVFSWLIWIFQFILTFSHLEHYKLLWQEHTLLIAIKCIKPSLYFNSPLEQNRAPKERDFSSKGWKCFRQMHLGASVYLTSKVTEIRVMLSHIQHNMTFALKTLPLRRLGLAPVFVVPKSQLPLQYREKEIWRGLKETLDVLWSRERWQKYSVI